MSLKQGLGIGAGIASDMMSASVNKKAAKRQAKYDKEQAVLEHAEGRKDTQYEAELSDYYGQLGKQRSRDARGKSFDKYSKIPLPEPELDEDGKPKPFRRPLVSANAPVAPEATKITPTAKLSKKQKRAIAAAETARQIAEINKTTATGG